MFSTLLLLSLSATVCLAGMGPCPTPEVMKDFELEKLAGTWYEIEGTAGVDLLAKRCSKYVLESKGKLKASLLHKYVSVLTGKSKSEFSELITPKSSEPAKLQMNPLKGTVLARRKPVWIIDTDYENYVLGYSCVHKVVSHTEEVNILARTKTVDDKEMMKYYDILKKKDINQKSLMKIDQEHKDCEE
ncbi:apolipoprotein D-like [Uloborus diversus]|uniref:apolipoprotein D-like n=1 Tax=Uloborus diversus TaxID=327109 RepID=UPI0024097530|nr:apolipoprotein D-like [Uloborus diversus]